MPDKVINNGKLSGLVDFLDNCAEKGRAPKKTCAALKVSIKKVFQIIEPTSWQEIEVKSLDLERCIAEFKNITAGKYADISLRTYKARTSRAIRWYLNFLNNPGWTPGMNDLQKKTSKKESKPKPQTIKRTFCAPQLSDTLLMDFQLPLSTGDIISLRLPKSITKNDSEKIKQFISILTMEEK